MVAETKSAKTGGMPEFNLTSNIIEQDAIDAVPSVAMGKLKPQAMLALGETSFAFDSPVIVSKMPAGRLIARGEEREYQRAAKTLLALFDKKSSKTKLATDSEIASIVKKFGRDNGKVLNLVNLENALIIYISENRGKGKELFKDQMFVSMLRVYFGELIGELEMVEEMLAVFGERGFIGGRHIGRLQDEYEDLVGWKKFANILKELGVDTEGAKEGQIKRLRQEIGKGFRATTKKPAGTKKWKSAQKLLSFVERAAAASFSNVVEEPVLAAKAGKFGKKEKMWVTEGNETLAHIISFMRKKGDPKVLSNSDFIELSKGFGKKFTLVGVQSALVQQLAQNVDGEVEDVIRNNPSFPTVLRLYFAGLIRKFGVTELIMTVLGETKIMTRVRGGRLSDDLDDLVTEGFYEELVNKASA